MTWSPPILNQWGVRMELIEMYRDIIDPTLNVEPMRAHWVNIADPDAHLLSQRISAGMARCVEAEDLDDAVRALEWAGFKPRRAGELFKDAETIRTRWADKHGYRRQAVIPPVPVEKENAPMPCGLCGNTAEMKKTRRGMYRLRCESCGVSVRLYEAVNCTETWNSLMARQNPGT